MPINPNYPSSWAPGCPCVLALLIFLKLRWVWISMPFTLLFWIEEACAETYSELARLRNLRLVSFVFNNLSTQELRADKTLKSHSSKHVQRATCSSNRAGWLWMKRYELVLPYECFEHGLVARATHCLNEHANLFTYLNASTMTKHEFGDTKSGRPS